MNAELKNQYRKLSKKKASLEGALHLLPKGSLRTKNIGGHPYTYRQYRDGAHIRSVFVSGEQVVMLKKNIEKRRRLESELREISGQLKAYERVLGIHRTYRPVKNVDYNAYSLFMSRVAHDFKRFGMSGFLNLYDTKKHRGIQKRYLKGFIDYIAGMEKPNERKTNDLVLDPYTYQMYFKYGDKSILEKEIKKAIPAFLNQGLLITSVQEAVHAPQGNR